MPGRRKVLQLLGPEPAVPAADSGDHALKDPRQRVAAQVRTFLANDAKPGATDGLHLCRWWHNEGARNFPDLLPGVRVLLSVPAGNAPLERSFGNSSFLLSPLRKQCQLHQQLLRNNACQLGLPGYTSFKFFPSEPEAVELSSDSD